MWRALRPLVTVRRATTAAPFYSRCAAVASSSSSSSAPARAARVLCVDIPQPLAEAACVQELVQRGHSVDHLKSPTPEQLASVVADYDAVLVSPTTDVPRELIAHGAAAHLQLIAFPSLAIDTGKVDVSEATRQGIVLLQLDKKQVGDQFSVEAEIALSLMIQLARHIPHSIAAVKAATTTLQREAFTGVELSNKTLGIVGLGQAGKCVVEMARAMGLTVFGYDPNLSHEAAALLGVKRATLDELYAQSDVISFHAPLTGRTRGMFNEDALAKCRDGVTLISVAEYKGRTGVLDHATVLSGLESGKIAGVGLDLLADDDKEEVSATWDQLVQHERVLARTHADGKNTTTADAKQYRAIAENISDALAQRYYRGVANGVFLPLTLVPEMQPFLSLSESLGRFLFDLVVTNDPKDPITKVTLATTGGIQVDVTTTKAKSALQSAVMKGILDCINAKRGGRGFDTPRISLLNATMIARNNGIDVRAGDLATADATTHLNNSVTVQVETRSKQTFLVRGSVFGEDPRIVQINEYTDFPAFRPEGNLLLFKNDDKPGAIAGILKELSEAKINIANFGLSRQENTPLALGILSLDAPVSSETMAKLKALPTVEDVQFARV